MEAIDAVIMWVNGNDPNHKSKRDGFIRKKEKATNKHATTEWRFLDIGEIKYCIYSIKKYAPWIRKIFLVTDDQIPFWLSSDLQKELNVIIIDHKIIFREHIEFLPTFNNISISNLLYKIPNLSNNYILFNDDTFLISSIHKEDFFKKEYVILRGEWHPLYLSYFTLFKRYIKTLFVGRKNISLRRIRSYPIYNSAKLVGYDKKGFESYHVPLALKVNIQHEYYSRYPEILSYNVSFRFRNDMQFGLSLFNHQILKTGLAIINNVNDSIMIIPRYGGLKDQRPKFDALKRGDHGKKFLCFQDLAFLKQENPEEFQEVIDWLEETIMR